MRGKEQWSGEMLRALMHLIVCSPLLLALSAVRAVFGTRLSVSVSDMVGLGDTARWVPFGEGVVFLAVGYIKEVLVFDFYCLSVARILWNVVRTRGEFLCPRSTVIAIRLLRFRISSY